MALHRFIVVILQACVVCPAASSQSRRVMSYNIRYGTANDGENQGDKWKEFLLVTIQTFDPDLLGTQETLGFATIWPRICQCTKCWAWGATMAKRRAK